MRKHPTILTPFRTMRGAAAFFGAALLTAATAQAAGSGTGAASGEAPAAAETTAQDAPAADPPPGVAFFQKVELTGLVDAYYTYNFNEPATGTMTPLRNFDVRHNQFSVAYLELAMNKAATAEDRVGFRFDLGYGQLTQLFNSDPLDNNALVNVQQAYVSYMAPAGTGLTIDVGKFVTNVGFEPTEANLNFNYSRAFMYALGPYYHVGARIGYAPNDKVSLTGMLVNGWSGQAGDNNAGKTLGGTIIVKPTGKVTLVENVLFGPEQDGNADDKRFLTNTNLAFNPTDKVSTGIDYYYVKDTLAGADVDWQAVSLYLRGQITPVFAVAPRMEFFNDDAGIVSGAVQKLKEFTLTGEFKSSEGLIFRLEYRRDMSNIDFFTKNGVARNNQNTFTAGFVYAFSSK
ncbi:MAG: porin [Vicinamibacterales bacterium]